MKQKTKQIQNGEIPEDWELKPLNEAVEINPKRDLKKGTKSKYVSMHDLKEFNKKIQGFIWRDFSGGSKFQNGDTIIARITPCLENGKTAFIDILDDKEIAAGSTEFIVLSEKAGQSTDEFVYYLSRSPKMRADAIASMTGTSGRQRVQTDLLASKDVIIPPLPEQEKIAKILSDLDTKIELNNKMNQILESIGQTLFKKWFVDECKKEWKEGKLGDYVDTIKGCSYRSEDLQKSDSALVTLKSINRGGGLNQDGYKEYVGEYREEQLLQDGDIIVAQTDLTQKAEVIGTPAIVNFIDGYKNLIASLDLQIVRPKEELTRSFVYYLLKTEEFHNHALSYTNGTTVLHLNKDAVPLFEFSVPDHDALKKFDSTVKNILLKIKINNQEIERLSQVRNLVLPKLMSGAIRVK